jgi:hypothetical protein
MLAFDHLRYLRRRQAGARRSCRNTEVVLLLTETLAAFRAVGAVFILDNIDLKKAGTNRAVVYQHGDVFRVCI